MYANPANRYAMPSDKPAEFGAITHYEYNSCCPSAFQAEYNYGTYASGLTVIVTVTECALS
jgi:hypothetical protein